MTGDDPHAERLWSQLLDLIEERRVVPIIGEELLDVEVEGRQLRLYSYLAERLAPRLGVAGLPPGASLNDVVCAFLADGGEIDDVYPELKRVMPDPDEIGVPAALSKLAEIEPLHLFVTTTFDPLMKRALDDARFGGADRTEVLSYKPADPTDLPKQWDTRAAPTVYHLLGRVSAVPEYVVSEEDLLEFVHALQSENRRPARLHDELTRNSLLLIGCSFSGWLARFFIRLGRRSRLSGSRGKLDVVADTAARTDEGLILFLDHFSTRTRVLTDTPQDFVDELHRRWLERAGEGPDPNSASSEVTGRRDGSVFISYASEDREYAAALRDALEAAGMEVWFDRDDLRAGDHWKTEIAAGLDSCSLFIPIVSVHTRTVGGRYFRTEWSHATEAVKRRPESQRFLMPLAIDDTPEDAKEIPTVFRSSQWFRVEGSGVPDAFVKRVQELYRAYQEELEATWR